MFVFTIVVSPSAFHQVFGMEAGNFGGNILIVIFLLVGLRSFHALQRRFSNGPTLPTCI